MNNHKPFALFCVFLFVVGSNAENLTAKVENLYSQLAQLSTQIEKLSTTQNEPNQRTSTEATVDETSSTEVINIASEDQVSTEQDQILTSTPPIFVSTTEGGEISTTDISENIDQLSTHSVTENEISTTNKPSLIDSQNETDETTVETLGEPEKFTSNVENSESSGDHLESSSAREHESQTALPRPRQTTREKLSGNAMILGWGGICLVLGAIFFAVFTLIGNHFAKKRDQDAQPIVTA